MALISFQVFYFTNFVQVCQHPERVRRVQDLVVSLLSDELVQVRQKAALVLGGLIHTQFIRVEDQKELVKVNNFAVAESGNFVCLRNC